MCFMWQVEVDSHLCSCLELTYTASGQYIVGFKQAAEASSVLSLITPPAQLLGQTSKRQESCAGHWRRMLSGHLSCPAQVVGLDSQGDFTGTLNEQFVVSRHCSIHAGCAGAGLHQTSGVQSRPLMARSW